MVASQKSAKKPRHATDANLAFEQIHELVEGQIELILERIDNSNVERKSIFHPTAINRLGRPESANRHGVTSQVSVIALTHFTVSVDVRLSSSGSLRT